IGLVVEFLESAVEPVRKIAVDLLDRFANFTATGGSAAATGLVRDRQGDAVIKRGGQERGLAEPRMANDGNALGVDVLVSQKVIDAAMQAPGPGGDGGPVIRAALGGLIAESQKQRVLGVFLVGRDVVMVKRRQGVATVDDLIHSPGIEVFDDSGVAG